MGPTSLDYLESIQKDPHSKHVDPPPTVSCVTMARPSRGRRPFSNALFLKTAAVKKFKTLLQFASKIRARDRLKFTFFLALMLLAHDRVPFALTSSYAGRDDAPLSTSQPRLRGTSAMETSAMETKNIVGWQHRELTTGNKDSSRANNTDIKHSSMPEQIHLALADARPRETYAMSVSWLTWVGAKSQVHWGRELDALDRVVTGNSTSEFTTARFKTLLVQIIFLRT